MIDKNFRLLYLPESKSEIKEVSLTRKKILFYGLAFASVLFVIAFVLGLLMSRLQEEERFTEVKNENRVLREQTKEMSDRIAIIRDEMKKIEVKDDEMRMVAGIEPLDTDVRKVGIGGSRFDFNYNSNLVSAEVDEVLKQNLTEIDKFERQLKLEQESYNEIYKTLEYKKDQLDHLPSIFPLKIGRITDWFGSRRRFRGYKPHRGLDISARYGTGVHVTADGVVEFVGWQNGYGRSIIINHNYGFKTLYGHLSGYNVKPGQEVKRNEIIGFVGSTGLSTAPHLHYEVRVNGVPQNPMKYYFTEF